MPLTLSAKGSNGPNAIQYSCLGELGLPSVTLASSQTTVTVAAIKPLGLSIKVLALSLVMTTVNGTAPVSVNLCAGTAAEGGLGPTDPGIYPPTAAQMMQNGNILWATDQPLNGTLAPVVNTPYTLYPVADMWDAIWPDNSLLTLRVSSGAGASGGVLLSSIICVPVNTTPYLPNGANPFAPSQAML